MSLLKPWATCGRAVAVDSTPLRAKGGVWHKKDRDKGKVPHTTIDTEAHWGKSGYHGWWYGWKLHLACTAARIWIPLAGELTPANHHDNTIATTLIEQLPTDARFVLGDNHYKTAEIERCCYQSKLV